MPAVQLEALDCQTNFASHADVGPCGGERGAPPPSVQHAVSCRRELCRAAGFAVVIDPTVRRPQLPRLYCRTDANVGPAQQRATATTLTLLQQLLLTPGKSVRHGACRHFTSDNMSAAARARRLQHALLSHLLCACRQSARHVRLPWGGVHVV